MVDSRPQDTARLFHGERTAFAEHVNEVSQGLTVLERRGLSRAAGTRLLVLKGHGFSRAISGSL